MEITRKQAVSHCSIRSATGAASQTAPGASARLAQRWGSFESTCGASRNDAIAMSGAVEMHTLERGGWIVWRDTE